MSILKVARMGHPVLRQRARPISTSDLRDPMMQTLINDMIDTMHEYHGVGLAAPQIHEDLIALDAALDRLKAVDEQSVRLVHLRYFVGLTIPEAAEMMGIAPRTADRLWAFARAWLHQEIAGAEEDLSKK